MDGTDLAQNRYQMRALVNTVMNLRVPRNIGKFLSRCTTGGFSGRAPLHELMQVGDKDEGVHPLATCSSEPSGFTNGGKPMNGHHLLEKNHQIFL
jgi:hypothetical protein